MNSPSRVVVTKERGGSRKLLPDADRPVQVAVVVAVGLAFASLLDFGVLWYPLRFGNMDWEFATVSAMADSLPLLTLTLGTLVGIAVWRGVKWALVCLGVLFALLALGALAMLVLHTLNSPIALRAVGLETRPLLMKAAAKTVALLGVYTLLYGLLAWIGLRAAFARRA